MRKIIACEFMTLDGVMQNEEAAAKSALLNGLVKSML